LLEDKTIRLLPRVLSGRLDLAFVRPPKSRAPNLVYRHLFYETPVVAEVDPGNGTSGLIGNGAVSVVVDGDDDE